MSNIPLRIVEKDTVDKNKALDGAISQIERSFGKGSIMKLGQRDVVDAEVVEERRHAPAVDPATDLHGPARLVVRRRQARHPGGPADPAGEPAHLSGDRGHGALHEVLPGPP